MAKTIKEIADELGVDKQRVYRFIKRYHISEAHHEAHSEAVGDTHQRKRSGVKYYDDTAEMLIKQGFLHGTASEKHISEAVGEAVGEAHSEAVGEAVSEKLITMLQKELEIKNEQIRDLNARLAEANSALVVAQQTVQSAQALHAGTIKQQIADKEAAPDVHTRKPEDATEKKKGWLNRLFGR